MIYDSIQNISLYRGISARLDSFIDYLSGKDLCTMVPGVYEVSDGVTFTLKEYRPRTPEEAGWESHQKNIDIQYVLAGRELMGVAPADSLSVLQPYNEQTDKTTYHPTERESVVRLWPGMFVILFPEDAHHPTIIDGEKTENKKAVVKIRV